MSRYAFYLHRASTKADSAETTKNRVISSSSVEGSAKAKTRKAGAMIPLPFGYVDMVFGLLLLRLMLRSAKPELFEWVLDQVK